ncbi:MAG: ABC-F family ATP-binding cassette domain-containing protein [Caulobacterales bacterium]|nr:ABC-F family ATP-binding cassette domain-containing protein [Caulobacterales bacterium]MCA0372384.1 ABC-F family ATP-binding cassette domain-containing protein [Pseudomonadota bacterium]
MLQISELTFSFGRRHLFDNASCFISDGWKVGLIGKNGTGKSTLLKLIREEIGKPNSPIQLKRGARMGFVAQEVAASDTPMMEMVLEQDLERHALMVEAETATDPHRIGEIHARLLDIDAYSSEARAAEIMVGLGFEQEDLNRPAREFSGGWRMRAALAGVLVSQPDLLILDEPTNYLDLEGAAWLENYLVKYPHTVLVVSHDREVLNRSVTHILALENQKLEIYTGGYDTYLRRRAERMANLAGQKAKQDAAKQHLQAFVDRFRAKASKARQAQSRIKMLEKMQDIQVPIEDRATPFHFYEPSELASPLIQIENADLGYIKGQPVLKNVNFRLDGDDRIVIIGPNGQGKTTLVKSIGERLALLNGERRAARNVKIGYFSQDSLDELHIGQTVLQHIRDMEPNAGEAKHRAIAASLGFPHEKIDTNVEKLSGGEKVRLLMGIMAYARPHILILDEPTSHLDIDSREALIHALNEFDGAVLLITHDVYLAEASADRLWLVHDGRATQYDGDLSDYRQMVLNADRPDQGGKSPKQNNGDKTKNDAPKPAKPKPTNEGNLKRKIERLEKDIAMEQAAIADFENQLGDPNIYKQNHQAAMDLTKKIEWHGKKLAKLEAEWEALVEELG